MGPRILAGWRDLGPAIDGKEDMLVLGSGIKANDTVVGDESLGYVTDVQYNVRGDYRVLIIFSIGTSRHFEPDDEYEVIRP